MKTIYINPKDPNQLNTVFSKIEENINIKSVLILMADKNQYGNNDMQHLLKNSSKDIIGGIFPEIIFEGERKQEGVLVITMENEFKALQLDLNSDSNDILNRLTARFGEIVNISGTLMVFCDAFAKNKNSFLETLFNYFGINVTYLGGGAGSLSFESSPCIISNEGINKDMAIIALIPDVKSIGVAHGWLPITEPMKVTKAIGNKVISINWQPAFSVYKKIVEAHSKQTFTSDNFFEIAKSYPLGIAIMDTEMIIRDPFMVEGNDMYIVDIVQEGEHISIMHGNMESLLNGAQMAKKQAFEASPTVEENIFCIDCISRVLYMESDFKKELSIIQGSGVINGILSIGEIANSGDSYLEIFNKTVVVAKW